MKHRTVCTIDDGWSLLTLAPPGSNLPPSMGHHLADPALRKHLLAELQRFRGKVYLEEGAVRRDELSTDGRHSMDIDNRAWHILAVDKDNRVCGCQRYAAYPAGIQFKKLALSRSALARSTQWGSLVKAAIESEKKCAFSRRIDVVEAGGWALAPEMRGTLASLKLALAPYSLARILGGCIGLATATHRHDSYAILKRIGGRSLALDGIELPGYYDAQYGCKMEILVFDSAKPNPRYEAWIEEIQWSILKSPVISADESGLKSLWAALGDSQPTLPADAKESLEPMHARY